MTETNKRIGYVELRRQIGVLRDADLSWALIAFALNHDGYRRDASGKLWTGPTVRHLSTGATKRSGMVPRRRGRPPIADRG